MRPFTASLQLRAVGVVSVALASASIAKRPHYHPDAGSGHKLEGRGGVLPGQDVPILTIVTSKLLAYVYTIMCTTLKNHHYTERTRCL